MADWKLAYHHNQDQVNKYNICKNIKIVYLDYKFKDKVMFNSKAIFKYDTPYNGPFEINQCWNNCIVTLECSAVKIRYNISRIKPYTYGSHVEYINL